MSLLNSVKIFLIESLDNYKDKKISFSILHATIAVELLLKARLCKIHPNLIFKDIDSIQIANGFTVPLSVLPLRLKNLGVKIGDRENQLIKKVAKWRNDIVHYIPTHEPETAKVTLCQLYNFAISFLKNELGEDIKNILPKKFYSLMHNTIDELRQIIDEAKRKALKKGHVDNECSCPICNIKGVISILNENEAYCYLCMQKLFASTCGAGCGKNLYVEYKYKNDGCEECVKEAEESERELEESLKEEAIGDSV